MQKFLLFCIKLYQSYISRYTRRSCRFHPTCSEYCRKCIESLPLYKALFYGFLRIAKCNPFHTGGIDEIPKTKD